MKFADIVAKSVHEKNIFLVDILHLIYKIERARQFCFYMCGIYSVWKIPQSLESIDVSSSWLTESKGTGNCLVAKGRPSCWSSKKGFIT